MYLCAYTHLRLYFYAFCCCVFTLFSIFESVIKWLLRCSLLLFGKTRRQFSRFTFARAYCRLVHLLAPCSVVATRVCLAKVAFVARWPTTVCQATHSPSYAMGSVRDRSACKSAWPVQPWVQRYVSACACARVYSPRLGSAASAALFLFTKYICCCCYIFIAILYTCYCYICIYCCYCHNLYSCDYCANYWRVWNAYRLQ